MGVTLSQHLHDKKAASDAVEWNTTTPQGHKQTYKPPTSGKVKFIEYDIRDFLQQCVDKYVSIASPHAANIRKVATPFLDEKKVLYDGEDDEANP